MLIYEVVREGFDSGIRESLEEAFDEILENHCDLEGDEKQFTFGRFNHIRDAIFAEDLLIKVHDTKMPTTAFTNIRTHILVDEDGCPNWNPSYAVASSLIRLRNEGEDEFDAIAEWLEKVVREHIERQFPDASPESVLETIRADEEALGQLIEFPPDANDPRDILGKLPAVARETFFKLAVEHDLVEAPSHKP